MSSDELQKQQGAEGSPLADIMPEWQKSANDYKNDKRTVNMTAIREHIVSERFIRIRERKVLTSHDSWVDEWDRIQTTDARNFMSDP